VSGQVVDSHGRIRGGSAETEFHESPERRDEGPGKREGPQDDAVIAIVAADVAMAIPAVVPAAPFPMWVWGEAGLRDHHDAAGIAPVVMGRDRDGCEGHED
jgi:hypothetical protein